MNKVNPTALLLSGVLMLDHLGETVAARRMYDAIAGVIGEGKDVTYDLGGNAGTSEMAQAIARRLQGRT
jgi:isocitrate dehydrogenase (NAD+)